MAFLTSTTSTIIIIDIRNINSNYIITNASSTTSTV